MKAMLPTSLSRSLPLSAALLLAAVTTAHSAPQQTQTVGAAPVNIAAVSGTDFAKFAPRPSRTTKLDFDIWDVALKEVVVYGGPSLRRRAERPKAIAGSRFILGHTSPYRLEGNKVAFEGIKGDFKQSLESYVDDLVAIGNRIDIPSLPRNEQLSYWLNLHNALVVREIADRYPIDQPDRIRGKDGLTLQDTKLVTIDGTPLSLRNIREDIVFSNWSDPVVIYGFFRGHLGSPSLQRAAYSGDTVFYTLRQSAREFAGSLRGIERYGDELRVSKIYEEAAPYYFPDFDLDVRAHIDGLGSAAVKEALRAVRAPLAVARYEATIADLTGGDGDRRPASAVNSTGRDGRRIDNSTLGRAVREQNEKYREIRQRGLNATVIIEDIETTDGESDLIDLSQEDD